MPLRIDFTREHIVASFRDYNRIADIMDPEAELIDDLSGDTPLDDYAVMNDFVPKWKVQHKAHCESYGAQIPAEDFRRVWKSPDSTLNDLADLIAKYAPPVVVPDWKFGGQTCRKGSLLRFLLAQIKKSDRAPVSGRTPLGALARRNDWTFTFVLMHHFPGSLPAPVQISHFRLLPRRLRYLLQSLGWGAGLNFVAAVVAFFAKCFTFALAAGVAMIVLFSAYVAYRRFVRVPDVHHIIFPGVRNLRHICERIARDPATDRAWT